MPLSKQFPLAVGSKQNRSLCFDVLDSARGFDSSFYGKCEVHDQVVSYDGCKRNFHLTCPGMHGRQVVNLEE
ncbi:unnamed protein product [Prunus armeniaca]|uniref:Uncharacterized protein n=1 Tax=Prunus armeniaca TaxID=36596 RepID=A0A6J5XT34_PRUAR|nr:unnamed protein product [Prunus armeniaca]